jgi:hypothetical protein
MVAGYAEVIEIEDILVARYPELIAAAWFLVAEA